MFWRQAVPGTMNVASSPVFDVASDGSIGLPFPVLSGGSLSMVYTGLLGPGILIANDPVESGLTQGDHGFAFAPGDQPRILLLRTRASTAAPGLFDVEVRITRWEASTAT